jgi:hypothetical protein
MKELRSGRTIRILRNSSSQTRNERLASQCCNNKASEHELRENQANGSKLIPAFDGPPSCSGGL